METDCHLIPQKGSTCGLTFIAFKLPERLNKAIITGCPTMKPYGLEGNAIYGIGAFIPAEMSEFMQARPCQVSLTLPVVCPRIPSLICFLILSS